MRFFRDIFRFWTAASSRYNRLKSNPEKQSASVSLGVRSIVSAFLGMALTGLSIWAMSLCYTNLNGASGVEFPIISVIGLAFFAILGLTLFVTCTLKGLVYFIYQLRLNKRAIGWIAALVWVVCLAALIIFTILIFAKL